MNYISIKKGSIIGKNAIIAANIKYGQVKFHPEITIGENCDFGDYINITSINKISIGNNVLTGRWVTITDNSHGHTERRELDIPPKQRVVFSKGPVIIEDNVWIGDKVTILSNVRIGKGAVIGANSVVTKDIPPYCVVGGIPAKLIKV